MLRKQGGHHSLTENMYHCQIVRCIHVDLIQLYSSYQPIDDPDQGLKYVFLPPIAPHKPQSMAVCDRDESGNAISCRIKAKRSLRDKN